MPRTRREKPLYQRGKFALHQRGTRNHEIIWYDDVRKRERSASAGTRDIEAAKIELDRLYLSERRCPTCHRPWEATEKRLAASIIADYLVAHASTRDTEGSISDRLDHVLRYIAQLPDPAVYPEHVDEAWIQRFRDWLASDPFFVVKGRHKIGPTQAEIETFTDAGLEPRFRVPSTIEGCVLQLRAAFSWDKAAVQFKPMQIKDLSRTPEYRASIETMAAMFRYCLDPQARSEKDRQRIVTARVNLLAYLRFAVISWARPDAIMDASTEPRRKQWYSAARVFNLNPVGRKQTRKFRATIVVPEVCAWWLDSFVGPVVPGGLSKATWRRMQLELGLPGDGQSGMKLIRRSISTIARKRLGEERWIQGKIMLGHVQPDMSDIYALTDGSHLGRVLAVTAGIVGEIEKIVPGAFYRNFTASSDNVVSMTGGKNG
jgi:hypothetical protein